MKIKLFVLFIIIFGCTSSSHVALGPSADNVYISNGVEQYFLPQLPYWANFSRDGKCFRKVPVRYLNFEKLAKSYNLKYAQMINLQHMVNRKMFAFKNSMGQDQLSPKDESYIFHNTYQKIIGGGTDFIIPKYKRLSVIYADDLKNNVNKLKKMLNRADIGKGFPVIVSRCFNSFEIEQILQQSNLDNLGIRYISAEMFTIYNKEMMVQPNFELDLQEFFKEKIIKNYNL